MKKVLFLGIACSFLLLLLSCTTMRTTPVAYTNNTDTKFEILGEVTYESADRTGYTELLRAARELYPDCDYVIDVMVDKREVTSKFLWFSESIKSTTWIMRGTAIKYVLENY